MKDIKIITMCGSMRFADDMLAIARDLETERGYCVIQGIYNPHQEIESDDVLNHMVKSHYKKIDLCDAIYVVNINGYIGETTQKEIEYAKSQGKEVFYYEPVKK